MKKFVLALSLGCLVALLTASSALATHARPKSASPLTFKLVPAFNACLGASPPGMTHGAPLALPSCSPPVQTSPNLTMNAPDRPAPYATGPVDGSGTIVLKVTCHTPGTTTEIGIAPCTPSPAGENIDVRISVTSTGVRCVGAAGQTHGPHNSSTAPCVGGTLYDGMVLGSSSIRITDHYSAIIPNPAGVDCSDTTSCAATSANLPFTVGAQCTAGACNYVTGSDLVVTDVAKEGKRAVVELGQLTVSDAGNNGDLIGGNPPATGICPPSCQQDDPGSVAFTQGLLIP